MFDQSQLTQEHVNNMVIRVRSLLSEVGSLDARVKLMLHLYKQFSTNQSVLNFSLLCRAIEDAELKIFDEEQDSEQNQEQDQDHDQEDQSGDPQL